MGDDLALIPCEVCGAGIPFSSYMTHSLACQPNVQQLSPWMMWYRTADAVTRELLTEAGPPRRTWLTFMRFSSDVEDAQSSQSSPGMRDPEVRAALGPVDVERQGRFRPDDVCPVCLVPFRAEGVPTRDLSEVRRCGHVFCTGCIQTWLAQHARCCPVCKCNVGSEPPEPEGQPAIVLDYVLGVEYDPDESEDEDGENDGYSSHSSQGSS